MQSKPFGKRTKLEINPVSIGGMRLPEDVIDSVKLIRHAIDSGLKYIDTSRGYGDSEFKLGRAMRDGYRQKVYLSSKCSPWIKKVQETDDGSADSMRRRIEETMVRLDTDYMDFYQVWNIDSPKAWETATKKGGMVDGIKKAMDEGIVRHTGFTTHDKPENIVKYLDDADWCEVILVSYNMSNRDYEPVLAKAKEVGIGTIVMNPVGGGKFAQESPVLQKIVDQIGAVSIPDLAVRYVLSNPNVDTILCGISKLTDPDHTIASAQRRPFSDEQINEINEYFESIKPVNFNFCTGCRYCVPCPQGIEIPGIMNSLYLDRFLQLKESAVHDYNWSTRQVSPKLCTECGQCEEKCTQKLPIIQLLKEALERFN